MKTVPFRLAVAALAVGAVLAIMAACDIDGDTYGFRLVNDTQEPLEYRFCSRDCETFSRNVFVEPGDSDVQYAIVGSPVWWQVRNEEEEVLGCLKFDHDRSSKALLRYVSKDLVPCP